MKILEKKDLILLHQSIINALILCDVVHDGRIVDRSISH